MKFSPRARAIISVVFDGRGGSNSRPLTLEVWPTSATVQRNSYQEADTWSMDFDARKLPVDPDQIASIAARIYMWDEDSLGAGGNWATEANEKIRGLADEIETVVVGDQKLITISGRDYTGVLDPEWDPRKKIPSGRPLDITVQDIADAAAPATSSARFKVEFRAEGSPPIVGAAHRSTKKKGIWVKPGKTYWDVIYEMCIAAGFIVYVDDSTIVITDPKAQTETTAGKAVRVAYGRHLEELSLSRKLARERIPQIQIAGWDPKAQKSIDVIYPERRNTITTAIGLTKDEVLRLVAPRGVVDRDEMLRYAKMRFDLMARPETTYKFMTRCLSVDDRSMLDLDTGDAVSIAFDPFNREHLRSLNVAQRQEFLVSAGHTPSIAAFVAKNLDLVDQFKQPYYTKEVTFEFSDADGLTISVEALNFASERREKAFAS